MRNFAYNLHIIYNMIPIFAHKKTTDCAFAFAHTTHKLKVGANSTWHSSVHQKIDRLFAEVHTHCSLLDNF